MATCYPRTEEWDNPPLLEPEYDILSGDKQTLSKAVTEALRNGWHLHEGLVFDERSGMLVQIVVKRLPQRC